MSIAEQVKSLRKAKQITQIELAARTDTTQAVIANIESGNRTPSKEMIKRLSKFFNVPAENFIDKPTSDNIRSIIEDISLIVFLWETMNKLLAEQKLNWSRESRLKFAKYLYIKGYGNEPTDKANRNRIKDAIELIGWSA